LGLGSGVRKRVLVAMSGGVDSSVSAALLHAQGYEVIGAMMRFWPEGQGANPESCCSPEAAYEARRVADRLGIPFYVLDYREIFEEAILEPFLEGYARGETPNPCVSCNSQIKFKALLKQAHRLGCDFLATGHYVRREGDRLLRGEAHKDQSYFLWEIPRSSIPQLLFPVGHLPKPQVRRIAAELGLPVAQKPESQNICFVHQDLKDFLAERISLRPGPILDWESGAVIGEHSGAHLYTLGQRRGLRLFHSHLERYVVAIDVEHNTLTVGPREACLFDRLLVDPPNLLVETLPERFEVQVRYRTPPIPARIEAEHPEGLLIRLEQPQFAITPGQSAVFYQGDLLLGGARIRRPLREAPEAEALQELTSS
jgi:tRNA-specific 2-thiouridylase